MIEKHFHDAIDPEGVQSPCVIPVKAGRIRRDGDEIVGGEIGDVGTLAHDFVGRRAQDRLDRRVGHHDMAILIGRDDPDRRDAQHDTRFGVHLPDTINCRKEVPHDLAHCHIVEFVDASVPRAAGDARSELKDCAVGPVSPGFCVAKGENENIHRFDHLAYGGEMSLPIRPHLFDRSIAVGFDARTKRINDAPVFGTGPVVELWLKAAIGALDELQKLGGGVDIAVTAGIHRIITALRLLRRKPGGRPFRKIIGVSARLQAMRDFLGETASRGRDAVMPRDFKGSRDQRIDREGRQRRHRLAPEAMVG